MNLSATRLAAVLAILLAATISTPARADYSIDIGGGARDFRGRAGDYRYAAQMRAEWLEILREIRLGSTLSLGLGVHLGGPELELRSVSSPASVAGREIDLNRWLRLGARLEFHDLQPYARLRYRRGRSDRGLEFRVDAGLRLLQVDDLTAELGGPMASTIEDRARLLRAFERETLDDLDEYYVEPLLRLDLNYRFG